MDEEDNLTVKPDGNLAIDLTKERDLRPLTSEVNPPESILKTPLYEAKVEPDVYFFGFDMTACEAKGGTGEEDEPVVMKCEKEGITWDDPGWFFVIKERSGEPRFGLDVRDEEFTEPMVKVWNDLSWDHVTPKVNDGEFLQISNDTQEITLAALADDNSETKKDEQRGEDLNIIWRKEMSSADLAYILYQVPVMVAVHASEMLPRD